MKHSPLKWTDMLEEARLDPKISDERYVDIAIAMMDRLREEVPTPKDLVVQK